MSRLSKIGDIAMRQHGNADALRSRTLWLTAAVLAAATAAVLAVAWTAELQATDIGRTPDTSARPAQTLTSAPPEPQAGEGHDLQDTEMLARELAATKLVLVRLLNRASGAGQAADREAAELRNALQEERERASRLEQDLAAARRDVETQTALAANAAAEASQLKNTAEAGTTDLQKSLQQERDRAAQLERDLALARKDHR
jgi:septal ring factor EnvC (AmiA/AmiB activator)